MATAYRNGRLEDEIVQVQETFGENNLETTRRIPTCILQKLILSPLVVFELLCLLLLFTTNQLLYFYGMLCVISIFSYYEVAAILQRESKIKISTAFSDKIMVVRRTREGISKKKLINSSDLVPGDLVEVTNYSRVPADLLLINGSCIIKDDFTRDNSKSKIRVACGTLGTVS